MSKFKIGDNIVCINLDGWRDAGLVNLIAGHKYTLTSQFTTNEGELWIEYANDWPEDFELVEEATVEECKELVIDMVNKPSHYQLVDDVEVKDVVKIILDRWENESTEYMTLYQAGCMKELLQYLLRAPLKNGKEDCLKAEYYLKEINKEW